jgi:polyhydroxybutyrate depolymerase
MKPILSAAVLLLGVILTTALNSAAQAATTVETITVGDVTRSFRLHIPEEGRGPFPLVLSIHGYRSNAAQQEKLSGFSALADREGFIVLYPDVLDDKWRFAGRTDADVEFLLAAIEAVAAKAPVDRNRIYSTGISNGAQMSWRLACDAPDVFAAFGFVSGAYLEVCNPPPRHPLIIFHGTADRLLSYESKGPFMGVRDFAIRWASGSGCNPANSGEIVYQKGDATGERFRCQSGHEVDLYTLLGKGHSWPGSKMPARITSGDVDATEAMWEFFRTHPKQ